MPTPMSAMVASSPATLALRPLACALGLIAAFGCLASGAHAETAPPPAAASAPVSVSGPLPSSADADELGVAPVIEDTVAPIPALEAAPLMVIPPTAHPLAAPIPESVLPADAKRMDWTLSAPPGAGSARQTGLASWYGPGFHGKLTASGELFNQHGMTAAHRTLPIPSYVRVRNVSTGKSVIVRINDRGPYHSDRVLDLSRAAAASLGATHRPTMVEIEPLSSEAVHTGQWTHPSESSPRAAHAADKHAPSKPTERHAAVVDATPKSTAPTTPPVAVAATQSGAQLPAPARHGGLQTLSPERAGTSQGRGWWLHLAAFQSQDSADSFYNQLGKLIKGFDPLLTMFQGKSERTLQAGPFSTKDEASKFGSKLREMLRISPALMERK